MARFGRDGRDDFEGKNHLAQRFPYKQLRFGRDGRDDLGIWTSILRKVRDPRHRLFGVMTSVVPRHFISSTRNSTVWRDLDEMDEMIFKDKNHLVQRFPYKQLRFGRGGRGNFDIWTSPPEMFGIIDVHFLES